MNLLNLTQNAKALEAIILEYAEAHDGMLEGVEAQIESWFSETSESLDAKLEGIARLLRDWEAKAKARKEEAKRLSDAAKADENRVERLKAWTKFCLESQGIAKHDAGPYTFAIQKNGGVAPLRMLTEDVERIPAAYLMTTVAVNTAALREDLAKGIDAAKEVAELGERGTSLRIK